ncbi:MAG: DUF350 domain-containing protein [Candidatus Marinimicrobia bacterium]|nr:DUF350 domain-containing protein [Candidatus Neomarinimicrobiota bacterium]MBT7900487.1 DUF350 domain-containing protein [Candidatus Neomarinimicrobiota bacterium]
MLQDPNSLMGILTQYGRAVGWSIAAAVGFAFGVGIALKVFDWLSSDIDEWEEIKKGNMGVALIFISLIVMVGLLVHKVI